MRFFHSAFTEISSLRNRLAAAEMELAALRSTKPNLCLEIDPSDTNCLHPETGFCCIRIKNTGPVVADDVQVMVVKYMPDLLGANAVRSSRLLAKDHNGKPVTRMSVNAGAFEMWDFFCWDKRHANYLRFQTVGVNTYTDDGSPSVGDFPDPMDLSQSGGSVVVELQVSSRNTIAITSRFRISSADGQLCPRIERE